MSVLVLRDFSQMTVRFSQMTARLLGSLLLASAPGAVWGDDEDASKHFRRSAVDPPSSECALDEVGGLQTLYDFRSKKGSTIIDRSGAETPLNLEIVTPDKIRRQSGRLQIRGEGLIRSNEPASRITEAIRRTQALTVEVWIRPATRNQDGPARIVSLSQGPSQRNFTLGQAGDQYDVRFRTTETGRNGVPSLSSKAGRVTTDWTHVVYTRRRGGQAKLFVNGKMSAQKTVAGGLSNWDESFHLSLGNETSKDRPWRGSLRRVAIYNRALRESEVKQHFSSGLEAELPEQVLANNRSDPAANSFHTEIAPLLAQQCLECHDTAAKKGGLDLSRKSSALAGGDSGAAIVPGELDSSLLWESVELDLMPHDRPPLSAEEKQRLKEWIIAGAPWPVERIDPVIYGREGKGHEHWVQRLTVPEYIETVRSAVGVDIAQEARRRLPQDKRADGFSNTAYNLTVDLGHVEAYAELAQIIVDRMDVVEFASRFSDNRRLTDDNMRGLISEMGKWLLRGPLEEYEVATFRGISTTVASAGGGFREAVRHTLEAMLQSPRFIYRIESQRGEDSSWPVSPYELASRLSYIIWGGPPDQELMRAAEAGELATCEQVESQVQRMLQDPRAVEHSAEFLHQWLDLDRLENLRPSPERFPEWQPELAADMRAETMAYFHEVVWQQRRPLTDLLNAQVSFLTPRLAEHYRMDLEQSVATGGGEGAESASTLQRVDVASIPSRGGLLTQGSVLTIGGDDASMVTRGLFILNDLLLSEVGDPPPGLDTTPVPPSPGASHRDIALQRVESEACGGCHRRFEPLAFGLEKFDGLGSYFEQDRYGNTLREDGKILFPGQGEPVSYESSAEMMDLLADSERVSRCLTRKVTQFALGRPLVPADQPSLEQIHATAQEQGGTYESLIQAIVMSDLVQLTPAETP